MSEIVRATIPIDIQADIILARSAGRGVARAIGFGTVDQTRLATAISELARNALLYGRGGICTIATSAHDDGRHSIHVSIEDHGPGIDNVVLALKPGFSSGGGLGQGLPAVWRLMDDLSIESRPGLTTVKAMMSRHP